MTDDHSTVLPDVVVDTSDVAAVRTPPGSRAFTGVYAVAYTLGVLAFLALGIFFNAWEHHRVGASFLLAALWVVPFLVVAHLLHLVLFHGARARRRTIARRAAGRVADQAAAAGYPALDVALLEDRLLRDDEAAIPYSPSGRDHQQPLRRWELATVDPSVLVAITREGAPETTRVAVVAAGSRPRRVPASAPRNDVRLLGAYRSDVPAPLVSSRLGGLPAVPEGFRWPRCAEHDEPMQFTAQLEDRGALVLVFLCQVDPGTCASWDPDSGCNAAIVTGGRDLRLAEAPTSPSDTAVVPGRPWLLGVRRTDASEHVDAVTRARADGVTVAGQWGGSPPWIQEDETPDGYRFLAMLDEEPLGVNLGSAGAAYVFVDDRGHAKVVTQA
ncbi:DUF1963 domain-containing protein [Curtobacterium sp. 9128]|uniref:DUF1963 domain-containing protein n=1 Tax=Curtobacterium sp. 9128 TaxID=1793722 RepID=UPI0011A66066|nr:DUF1963 domain-containing protein [Curtobacterium sp. 9128]